MASYLTKKAILLVSLPPAVYTSLCACGTIGEVAHRYLSSNFLEDPVVKQEISKLYDRAEKKKSSSESLFELIDQEERAAVLREVRTLELSYSLRRIAEELEAELALNIWKQNCRRSMIANFQRRLKYYK